MTLSMSQLRREYPYALLLCSMFHSRDMHTVRRTPVRPERGLRITQEVENSAFGIPAGIIPTVIRKEGKTRPEMN